MAVNQKLSEIGWFYHAPEKRHSAGPIPVPLASQIPGLNDFSDMPAEEPPRTLLRDTDTKYIRLAKMGGREDLLRFPEPKPKSKEPVPYPRNDWFYLEDNRIETETAEPKQPWEFRLPEYMVHDEFKPFGDDYDYKSDPENRMYWKNKNKKSPLYGDGCHVYERDGASLQQIRGAKIPEDRPSGYGVRGLKQPRHKDMSKQQTQSRKKAVSAEESSRYPALPAMYDTSARPAMNKLLAYGYEKEWQKVRDDWYYEIGHGQGGPLRSAGGDKPRTGSKKATNVTTWNELRGKQPASPPKHTNISHVNSAADRLKPLPPIGSV